MSSAKPQALPPPGPSFDVCSCFHRNLPLSDGSSSPPLPSLFPCLFVTISLILSLSRSECLFDPTGSLAILFLAESLTLCLVSVTVPVLEPSASFYRAKQTFLVPVPRRPGSWCSADWRLLAPPPGSMAMGCLVTLEEPFFGINRMLVWVASGWHLKQFRDNEPLWT